MALQVLGRRHLPSPQHQDRPADLVALTQHMTVFLPGDGLGAGVLGPRKAMWLRGHGAGLQLASPRLARCGAPALPRVLGRLRPRSLLLTAACCIWGPWPPGLPPRPGLPVAGPLGSPG